MLRILAKLSAAAVLGTAFFLGGIGWWIDSSDEPAPADAIVVLAGGYTRPIYGAELYRRGLAPEVWISQPKPSPEKDAVRALGVPFPREEAVNRAVLIAKGVPPSRIRLYGLDADSTLDEARALDRELRCDGKKILVVTSRYHVRRARLIFRRALPRSDIRVTASPFDDPKTHWWMDKHFAPKAALEAVKTVYYWVREPFI